MTSTRSCAAELDFSAAERLRMLLADLSSKPDSPLPPERDLSTRFGVSRRAIRQALSELEAEGRVWRRQGKGTFAGPAPAVVAPTLHRMAARTNFFEVMEVRLSVEPVLAQLAAGRASGEQVALMRRLAGRTAAQTSATPASALEEWDGAFHRAIAEAAGNRLFLDLFEMVDRIRQDPAWQCYRDKARRPERLALGAAQHVAIAAAIARREGAEAARIMRQHIGALRAALGEAVDDG